jgi:His-Xaa-Ser system radical SAM maturase HxsC
LPEAELAILTNAQTLADFHFAHRAATLAGPRTTFCISLHADTADLHNSINGTKDGFKKTVLGIQNLAKLRQRIEVRFVINKLNYQRLVPYSLFIYRNFPFVVHVAFMGLEMTGWAFKNVKEVWIDPPAYREELRLTVMELHRRDIRVSIYNLPLCLIDRRSWRFSRQSISAWKNSYLPLCADCSVKQKCCGVFTTSKFFSSSIAPIKVEHDKSNGK